MAINRTGTNPTNDVKLPTIDIEPEIMFHMCSLWETGAIDSNGAVTGVAISNGGVGYADSETVTCPAAQLGTGASTSLTVT